MVLNEDKLEFMNDLSNKVMSFVTGMKDFKRNLNLNNEKRTSNQLDRKIFYLFKNNGKHKEPFCLNDIAMLTPLQLKSKIFTCDYKLSSGDFSKAAENKNLE